MHKIWDLSEIRRIRKGRRESNPKRLEDCKNSHNPVAKYADEEVNQMDVIVVPKIDIIEYSIDSSINRNKSQMSAAYDQDGFDQLSSFHYNKASKSTELMR